MELAKLAASKGSPTNQLVWGLALLHGSGGEVKDKTAGNGLMSSAESGLKKLVGSALRSPTDVFFLGCRAYADAYCSLDRAAELFAEAAEDGHAIAQVVLANLDLDLPRAIGLLRRRTRALLSHSVSSGGYTLKDGVWRSETRGRRQNCFKKPRTKASRKHRRPSGPCTWRVWE